MTTAQTYPEDGLGVPVLTDAHTRVSGAASAVSWAAIFAGAAAAAVASLLLLSLGTGLGLSAISPWADKGVEATTFGVSSIVWVIVTQLCASALGGYLAGRLRTRWIGAHSDEVYFRDTAHGLLSWAVATLLVASMVASVIAGAAGVAAKTGATLATGAAVAGASAGATQQATAMNSEAAEAGPMGYLVDSLFRAPPVSTTPVLTSNGAINSAPGFNREPGRPPVGEVARIFVNSRNATSLPQQDVQYLGQLVAQRTGMTQADSERRVTDTFTSLQTSIANAKTQAKEAADKARKTGIQIALWIFIALLSGAFIASYTALLGGRERDA